MHMSKNILLQQLEALLDSSCEPVSNLANACALLFSALEDINWVGFYLLKGGALYLGPFQGKPACTRIPAGCGVCGAAIARNETMRVEDVRAFPGHIACDCASKSELVLVLRDKAGTPFGVLDADSPKEARFTKEDAELLGQAAEIVSRAVEGKIVLGCVF